jgi:hypothetical protein
MDGDGVVCQGARVIRGGALAMWVITERKTGQNERVEATKRSEIVASKATRGRFAPNKTVSPQIQGNTKKGEVLKSVARRCPVELTELS